MPFIHRIGIKRGSGKNLKIVTVNVPESYIDAIEKLIGENGLYPSRSELIRCAVREFLIKELKLARRLTKAPETSNEEMEEFELDKEKFIRIPFEKKGENGEEPKIEFKTYKILRRLEH